MSHEDTVEKMMSEIERLLEEYWKQYGQPLALRMLAAKFGKRSRRFGGDLTGLLKRDSRFLVDMDINARHRVSLLRQAGLNHIIPVMLKRNGNHLRKEILFGLLDGQGEFSPESMEASLSYLERIGVLSLSGNDVFLRSV